MYYKGQGVRQDYAEAWAWFTLALDKGYKLASDSLHELSNKISRQQMEDAKRRYQNYKQRLKPR
ncbi:MAG: SEL1-like repeat protein [Gammaproteobacteria bacterium]|nr:SEL1-like repeat protein [Gammaproteobacteria bacterium]